MGLIHKIALLEPNGRHYYPEQNKLKEMVIPEKMIGLTSAAVKNFTEKCAKAVCMHVCK